MLLFFLGMIVGGAVVNWVFNALLVPSGDGVRFDPEEAERRNLADGGEAK